MTNFVVSNIFDFDTFDCCKHMLRQQDILEAETTNLVHSFLLEKPSGRSNNPPAGRSLGHVTPKIFGIQSNISSKLIELETSSLECIFVYGKPSGRINNFPPKARGIGHVSDVTPKR